MRCGMLLCQHLGLAIGLSLALGEREDTWHAYDSVV